MANTLERNAATHVWHDLHVGSDAPTLINAVVTIPQHSKVKYMLDKKSGLLKVDKVLMSASVYPHNFGFIPRTMKDDGEPVEILIMTQVSVVPMSIIRAKPIGIVRILDQGDKDDKVVAVCADDPEFKDYNDLSELPAHRLAEIRGFFQDYKKLEGRTVTVEEMEGTEGGVRAVKDGMDLYTTMVVRDLQG
eukprot:CAMPEP_0198213044 /NCGR_PEP_ID=MMETSP1445-20131203/28643_1 /TAXON_ID=36898 /ORGANISM="Pyramimonas sp., Strain CCMP2087" /LENGTH=190 /DNA_ID=CAMNT_0043887635 /DNA_START=90 /DNA_END=662 /DNA_ORIENTATION=+